VTRTATSTRTYTATGTVTATATPYPDNVFYEDFIGPVGQQPTGWQDATNVSSYRAQIAYSDVNSYAAVTRTSSGKDGEVRSPQIVASPMEVFRILDISVTKVSTGAQWQIGIIRNNKYYALNAFSKSVGTFSFDYPTQLHWAGSGTLRVDLWVKGAPGQYIEVDRVRLGQPGVQGAGVVEVGRWDDHRPARTPTGTPTAETFTGSPSATATASPSQTASPRPSPEIGRILAYPQPARGRVNIAYFAEGSVSVRIDLYTISGERAALIQEDRDGGSGRTLVTTWEASGAAPGIYLCRITLIKAGAVVAERTLKIALIR
jgi:hypothetical protein